MRHLILIRHGQSTGNVDRDFYKLPDSCLALTYDGVQQAVACAVSFRHLYPDVDIWRVGFLAFCSGYTRAQQTGRIILDCMGARQAQMTVAHELNEHASGEVTSDMVLRSMSWVDRVKPLLTCGDIMVFSHCHLLAALSSALKGTLDCAEETFYVDHCTPIVFKYDHNSFKLVEPRQGRKDHGGNLEFDNVE